jgi:hypothetical protein
VTSSPTISVSPTRRVKISIRILLTFLFQYRVLLALAIVPSH